MCSQGQPKGPEAAHVQEISEGGRQSRSSGLETWDPEMGSPHKGQQGGQGASQNKEWEAIATAWTQSI